MAAWLACYLTGVASAVSVRIRLLVAVERPEGASYRAFSGCWVAIGSAPEAYHTRGRHQDLAA